jgi:DNA-directed RNA polymerase subunit alpha
MPGCAITSVKIEGVPHEFSTIENVKEDVIMILLNIKKIRFSMSSDEPVKAFINVKGSQNVTAKQITVPGQLEIMNPDQHIATLTDKNASLSIELVVEKGLGYVPKEVSRKEKAEIGTIMMDAIFTPIRRVSYEVENMRVGNRTDYNRLRMFIETDGIIAPRTALERSIEIMIQQLKAIVGFKEAEPEELSAPATMNDSVPEATGDQKEKQEDILKTRVEDLELSARTLNALTEASIRTIGGLARKREEDLLELEGLGEKGISEIKRALANFGITLRE